MLGNYSWKFWLTPQASTPITDYINTVGDQVKKLAESQTQAIATQADLIKRIDSLEKYSEISRSRIDTLTRRPKCKCQGGKNDG